MEFFESDFLLDTGGKILYFLVGITMLVLSIYVGYSLYKGGREINNVSISNAGVAWLSIIALSIITSIIIYW